MGYATSPYGAIEYGGLLPKALFTVLTETVLAASPSITKLK